MTYFAMLFVVTNHVLESYIYAASLEASVLESEHAQLFGSRLTGISSGDAVR